MGGVREERVGGRGEVRGIAARGARITWALTGVKSLIDQLDDRMKETSSMDQLRVNEGEKLAEGQSSS